jgi:Fe-S oxidoreductase
MYYQPEVGLAALRVLERLGHVAALGLPRGYKPVLAPAEEMPHSLVCCGRPLISNGMLDKAVRNARQNVESLYPWAASGKSITACEPSCILTIKDDYPALLQGDWRRKAEVVAAVCRTFEEASGGRPASGGRESPGDNAFTAGLTSPGDTAFTGRSTSPARRILVQPHCHQRSLVGPEPLLRLLRRIPNADIVSLDAGCCGMAGSFGYETEHYEISRLVGEQRLFPAIRAAAPDTVIVAPGFSCRLQIEHFTGRKAVHPAELLHSLLVPAK